jgi:hypothetical protein
MKNSIKPDIWGPHGWKFMHYVSMGYPDNPTDHQKTLYKNFYYSLQDVLPCDKCAENYKKNLIENPIDNHMDNRESLMKWVVDIHNSVNKELNKDVLDYDTAIDIYISGSENTQIYEMCFKLSVLIIILYFVYLVLKK